MLNKVGPKIIVIFIVMTLLLIAYEVEGDRASCAVIGGYCKPAGTCRPWGHLNAACPPGLYCCSYP